MTAAAVIGYEYRYRMLRYLSALLRLELRMAEELKPSRRDAMYGKGESRSAPEGSAAEEASESPAEEAAEQKMAPHERQAAEREEMRKKHEAEMRDAHGGHRENMRKMHARQEAEHKAMMDRHMQEASRGEAAVAGATPGGEGGAVGGAGEVPQAQAA